MSINTNSAINNIRTFAGSVGKTARRLNRIAIRELKSDNVSYTFPKATAEDLKRLTSKKIEDTYKRVKWTNPKDGKVYHILEEGRSKKGIDVRILSSEGEFIKNAQLQPKTVVIFDQFKNLCGLRNMLRLRFPKYPAHGEIVETYLRRANPFVTVEHLEHKKNIFEMIKYRGQLPQTLTNKRFAELDEQISKGRKVDYISISEVSVCDIGELSHKTGKEQKDAINESVFNGILEPMKRLFSSITQKGTRIFASASNEAEVPKQKVNTMLAIDGVEGVGSLIKRGSQARIASDSASRNSTFTQHYEARNFHGRVVEENGQILGINITGQPGAELPYNEKNKTLLRDIGGTSFSTPIRVGKIALNDMMEGIL